MALLLLLDEATRKDEEEEQDTGRTPPGCPRHAALGAGPGCGLAVETDLTVGPLRHLVWAGRTGGREEKAPNPYWASPCTRTVPMMMTWLLCQKFVRHGGRYLTGTNAGDNDDADVEKATLHQHLTWPVARQALVDTTTLPPRA